MWALTLRQPWAWMVVHGTKDVENRSWVNEIVLDLMHQGGEFAIHAGFSMTRGEYADAVAFARQEDPELVVPSRQELEFGQVIGTAGVKAIYTPVDYVPPGRIGHLRWHLPERFGWLLKDRRALPFPIHMGGKQGFWKLDDAVVERARRVA